MANDTTTARTLAPICPKCGEGCVSLWLDDLTTFQCRDCEEEFSIDHVRSVIAAWTPILKWIDAAPVVAE